GPGQAVLAGSAVAPVYGARRRRFRTRPYCRRALGRRRARRWQARPRSPRWPSPARRRSVRLVTDQLLVERRDHVEVLTLNRPDRMNTISGPMLQALSEAMVTADADQDVRCIVITGAGPKAFCAGLDLQGASDR